MRSAAVNPRVLSHLYLSAVLPCLSALATYDPVAREILGPATGTIVFRILRGRAVTVRLEAGAVTWQAGAAGDATLILVFLSDGHLNAFFSGNGWALPLPAWGGWRIGLQLRFARLAARLEAVMDGHAAVLATAAGRALHARLSLIAAGLGLTALAGGDAPAMGALRSIPHGLASFTIGGQADATVWFDHGSADHAAGWGEPPRRPDVTISFVDVDTAYAALREEIDTLAAVGLGHIRVDGLVPLADGLNFVMERLGIYLQT